MDIIKIDFENPNRKDINLITSYFKKGKIIAYPTDTVYGLGCIATDKKAIKKIFKIKKRDSKKALLVLIKSFPMLKKYFFLETYLEKYLRSVWPGPVSVLLKKRDLLSADIAPKKERIAVRLPRNDFLIKIINKVGCPIVSTSLNISGKKPLAGISDVKKHFKTRDIDLVVDIGKNLSGKPSRLIDIEDINNIKVLRK